MRSKPFYQQFVVIRSVFNPLRYLLGKEKVLWGQNLADYVVSKIEINTEDIRFEKNDE